MPRCARNSPDLFVGLLVGLGDAHVEVLAHRDLRAVAAEPLAVRGERVELARELFGPRRQVRLVRVLRDHAQRLLLPAATDHHGDARERAAAG